MLDLTDIAARLSRDERVLAAYVLGSANAFRLIHNASYIDSNLLRILTAMTGFRNVAVTCDLTALNGAGIVLRHEALKGRVLFMRPGREGDYTEFYVHTCAEYEDLMAWRARQLAYRGYACPSTAS